MACASIARSRESTPRRPSNFTTALPPPSRRTRSSRAFWAQVRMRIPRRVLRAQAATQVQVARRDRRDRRNHRGRRGRRDRRNHRGRRDRRSRLLVPRRLRGTDAAAFAQVGAFLRYPANCGVPSWCPSLEKVSHLAKHALEAHAAQLEVRLAASLDHRIVDEVTGKAHRVKKAVPAHDGGEQT